MSAFTNPGETIEQAQARLHSRLAEQGVLAEIERLEHEDPPAGFIMRLNHEAGGSPQLEAEFAATCWFPYRLMNFVQKTHAFVSAYNEVYTNLIDQNTDIAMKTRKEIKRRGSYMKPIELMAPWLDPKSKAGELKINPRWKDFVTARRAADRRGMIYTDFVAGAIISAMRRGWTHWPFVKQLATAKLIVGVDEFHEATIIGFEEKKYAERAKMTEDPYFRADAYRAEPLQDAYYAYLKAELLRVHPGIEGFENQRVRRLWAQFQKDGRIAASVDYSAVLASE